MYKQAATQSGAIEENPNSNVIRLERVESETADRDEMCEFIGEMTFDLALMAERAGMSNVAQALKLAALEIGLTCYA